MLIPSFLRLDSYHQGSPVLLSSDGCLSVFEWRTSAACPLVEDSGDDCQVVDPVTQFLYDLTPLMQDDDFVFVFVIIDLLLVTVLRITSGEYQYRLHLCGKSTQACDNGNGLDPNTAACQISTENNFVCDFTSECLSSSYTGLFTWCRVQQPCSV